MDIRRADDEIRLTGLRVRGHHGVFEREKRDGQDFVVDAVLRGDLTQPAHTDDLADTIDYGTLADDLAAIIAGPPFDLIEALAGALVDACLTRCADAEVTVHKPQAPIAHAFADVAVTLRRTRDDTAAEAAAPAAVAAPAQPATSERHEAAQSLRAVIALGANLGEAKETLQDAARALDLHPRIRVLAGSPIYVTAPEGGISQPDFHNAAVLVESTLPARELLAVCQGVEVAAGRTREVRWGPRTLDLDLIAARDARTGAAVTSTGEVLTLPHPLAAQRAFVLFPWADVDPDAVATTEGGPVPVAALRDRLAAGAGIARTGDTVWEPAGTSGRPGPAPSADPGNPTGTSGAGGTAAGDAG